MKRFDISNPAFMQAASHIAEPVNPLMFTAIEDSTIKFVPSTVRSAEYSFDKETWINADNITVNIPSGGSVYYRGTITANQDESDYSYFETSGKISSSGSIMSLSGYNENIQYKYEFYKMFYNCSSLTSAPELPATTLASLCYTNMFNDCTSLTTAPELPATTLASYCYSSMFSGCTSLTTAPELPATTLASYCYSYMFNGCTSLTTAPELPATSLESSCYIGMFRGCTSLISVTHHVTNWNTSDASSWLNNVSSSGTVICPVSSTIPNDNTSGIPTGWTRQNL